MYICAAFFIDWRVAEYPEEKNYFLDVFDNFFENERLSMNLIKCFRGSAAISENEILAAIRAECELKAEYLDEDKKLDDDPVMDVDVIENEEAANTETEHVCSSTCRYHVSGIAFDSESILEAQPDLAEEVLLLTINRVKTATGGEADDNEEMNDEIRERRAQAAYVATLMSVEDTSKFVCPLCETETTCNVHDNAEDDLDFRFCPKCKQAYHAACRKRNKNLCIKCNFVRAEAEEDALEEEKFREHDEAWFENVEESWEDESYEEEEEKDSDDEEAFDEEDEPMEED
uniref:Phorbol-ester/DAG-type domain-containing protein n=1 Tax=Panagrolaimus sp. ES5 TaxID=591445 RepID=A0AC34FGZ2_9BILA